MEGKQHMAEWCRLIAGTLWMAVALVSPWLFGGAVESHQAYLAWLLAAALPFTAAANWFCRRVPAGPHARWESRLICLALIVLGGGILQCVQLPQNVLQRLSPAAAAIWEASIEATAATESVRPDGHDPSDSIDATQPPVPPHSKRTTISLYPGSTWTELARFAVVFAAFLVALEVFRSDKWRICFLGLLFANGLLFVAFSWLQDLTWNEKIFWAIPYSQTGRPFGAYVNRNHAGGFLNFCIAAAAACGIQRLLADQGVKVGASSESPWTSRRTVDMGILIWAGCAILIAGILSTQSRGAILSLLAAGVVTSIRLLQVSRGKLLLPIVVSLSLLLGSGLLLTWWVGKANLLRGRMSTLVDDWSAASTGRIDHWADSVHMIPDYWRTGSGLGTYRYLYRLYESGYRPAWYYHAENCYLEIAVDGGIIGLALFLAMWGIGLRLCFPLSHREHEPSSGALSQALSIAGTHFLAAQAVHAALDFNLYMPANAIILASFLALLVQRNNNSIRLLHAPPAARDSATPHLSRDAFQGTWPAAVRIACIVGCLVGLTFAAQQLSGVGKIATAANRIDQWQGDLAYDLAALQQEYDSLKTYVTNTFSAEGADRLARLSELMYRTETYHTLRDRLPSASPKALWQLTDLPNLHQRMHSLEFDAKLDAEERTQRLKNLSAEPPIRNELRQAWTNYGFSIAACPLRATPYVGRARLALLYGSPEKENDLFDLAVASAPQDVDLLFDLARYHFQAQRNDRAIELLRRALRPTTKYAIEAADLARNFLPSDEVWQRIYSGMPMQAVAVGRQLGATLGQTHDRHRLADVISQSLENLPLPESQRYYLQATVAEFRGDLADASAAFDKALMLEPSQAAWHYEYALVLAELEETGKALEHARQSAVLNPKGERYKHLEQQLEQRIRQQLRNP